METSKNIINDSMKVYSSTKRQEMRHVSSISQISLIFMDGCSIKELSYNEEYGDTRRKVRRIIEKRVCQNLHNKKPNLEGNDMRFRERRQSAKQVKRICGRIPYAFSA
ncbi:MAG: hypothetical protein IJK19_04635 [Bacteroidales bacterium]|nr:hypothetical protein [Bacteroidales bacterium]